MHYICFIPYVFISKKEMMNLLMLFGNAIMTFLVINTGVIDPHPSDPNYWIGFTLAFISGFGLRIMGDIRKRKYTLSNSFIQFFTSICLCFLAYLVREDFTPRIRIEYYVFFCALSSVFMIDAIEKNFQLSFWDAVKLLFRKLSTPVDETPKNGGIKP